MHADVAGLSELQLTCCSLLCCLPASVLHMRGLRSLVLENCSALESLPSLPTGLQGLNVIGEADGTWLVCHASELTELDPTKQQLCADWRMACGTAMLLCKLCHLLHL